MLAVIGVSLQMTHGKREDGDAFLMKARYAEMPFVQSDGQDSLASLGLGMSWVRDWCRSTPSCIETSMDNFIASKKDICIPHYSDPVPWEEDPRYTVEDSGCGSKVFRSHIRKGDNIGDLFSAWLEKEDVSPAVRETASVFKLNRLRIGKLFSVERCTESGIVSRFMYDIDDEHRLIVRRSDDGFKASIEVYEYDTKMVRVCGKVSSSLFDAVTEAGEDSALAMQLADVFGHQVDFINEVREGDSFEVVVEKKYIGSQFRRYGDIIAARFLNDGTTHEAFRFFDDKGDAHYYSADGSSLETQFLRAPLDFTRISSRYSMKRKHPILGVVRPHQGVDYAAPRGTPVKALGAGVVTFVGWKKGYGKTVAIRHGGSIETHYAHLSRYTKNLRKGTKVDQGQVIAFVGSTGMSTGPHLDFRVKKNGKFVDPLKLKGSRSAPIPKEQRAFFDGQVRQARLLLDGEVIVASK